ncbi:MAG TPA: divalent-cation tolerance protein CutA [Oculatellaceae cyanobacterium]
MTDEIVIFVTCPPAESDGIASTLVSEQLAACVNIVSNVTSIYRWEGKVTRDREDLLIIKTEQNLWQTLKKRVCEIHPYEVPEIIKWSINDGYEPYLKWIADSVDLAKNIDSSSAGNVTK